MRKGNEFEDGFKPEGGAFFEQGLQGSGSCSKAFVFSFVFFSNSQIDTLPPLDISFVIS